MKAGDAELVRIMNMAESRRLRRQLAYRCRHPDGVPLGERDEVEFQLNMPTAAAAREIGILLLAARQKVQRLPPEREPGSGWRVVVRPVMLPYPENIAEYRRILGAAAAVFSGSVATKTARQPVLGRDGAMRRAAITFEFVDLTTASPLLLDWLARGESLHLTIGLRRTWWVSVDGPMTASFAQRQRFKRAMLNAAAPFGGEWVVSDPGMP